MAATLKIGQTLKFLTMGDGPQEGFVISQAPGTGCWWVRASGRYYKVKQKPLGTAKVPTWIEHDDSNASD